MNIVLTPVDILGTLEEARHIVLENCERLVELLEDADNSVVLLNVLLCLSHRYLCIEASEEKENGWLESTLVLLILYISKIEP